MRQSKAEKQIDRRINAAYYATCTGIQIDIMDIGKVFDRGRELIAGGADDNALADGIRAFVETIRRN